MDSVCVCGGKEEVRIRWPKPVEKMLSFVLSCSVASKANAILVWCGLWWLDVV